MTLTAAQAMIVRAFIADERLKGGDPWCKRADVEHALRAALVEKDKIIAELEQERHDIERLMPEAAQHEEEPYEGEYWRPGTDNYGSLE